MAGGSRELGKPLRTKDGPSRGKPLREVLAGAGRSGGDALRLLVVVSLVILHLLDPAVPVDTSDANRTIARSVLQIGGEAAT
jgi:hypothetical protein